MSQIPEKNELFESEEEYQLLLQAIEMICANTNRQPPAELENLSLNEQGFKRILLNWTLKVAEEAADAPKAALETIYLSCLSVDELRGRAECEIGYFFLYGWVHDKDVPTALEWFEKAGNHGCGLAYHVLGNLYANGKVVPGNYQKAQEYYEKSAELEYPMAYYHLGDIYAYGRNGITDLQKAFEYFKYGADNLNCAYCQNRLGTAYNLGKGVAVNKPSAYYYWKKAAETDPKHFFANFNVAIAYKFGIGTQVDLVKAKKHLETCLRIDPTSEDAKKMLNEVNDGLRNQQTSITPTPTYTNTSTTNTSGNNSSGTGIPLKYLIIAAIIIICLIASSISSCVDPVTTYYLDYNGNGKEDWGEAQYYEDKDGIHWLD